MTRRQRQRVAAKRIAELARHHHLEDRRLALRLRLRCGGERRADVRQAADGCALRAHRARNGRPRWLLVEIHADKAIGIEVDMVFLLGAPLAVVEYDRGDGDVLTNAGLDLAEAHAPRAIADVGDSRAVGRGDLGADNRGERVAAVAEAHRREHRARTVEAQIRIRHRADIADVGRHHRRVRHRLFELAQHLPRVHMRRALRHFQRPRVLLVRPGLELGFPRALFRGDDLGSIGVVRAGRERLAAKAREKSARRRFGVAADAYRDSLHQTQHFGIGIDLNDFRVFRPVVDIVLRQGSERSQPRSKGEHDVGLGDELHRRFRALIAQRPAPQRMIRRKRVVVQVTVAYRRGEQLGQLDCLRDTFGHHHAAAAENHRELRLGDQLGRIGQALLASRAALDGERRRDLAVDIAVEKIARNVYLRRPQLEMRPIECTPGQLGDACAVVDVRLVFGDLGKDRQLLGFLESSQAQRHRAGFRRDDDDRRMRPVRRGDRSDEVGDAGAILRNAHAVPPGHSRVAIGHMAGALLVGDGNEASDGKGKKIQRIHVSRADDAEHVCDALRHQRLDKSLRRRHLLPAGDDRAAGQVLRICHGVHRVS